MKRVLLVLFLATGASGTLSANNLSKFEIQTIEDLTTSSCYIQVIVNHENICGEYVYSTASPAYEVNCRPGQTSGSTSTFYETRLVSGWNLGSGPEQPTTCVN